MLLLERVAAGFKEEHRLLRILFDELGDIDGRCRGFQDRSSDQLYDEPCGNRIFVRSNLLIDILKSLDFSVNRVTSGRQVVESETTGQINRGSAYDADSID